MEMRPTCLRLLVSLRVPSTISAHSVLYRLKHTDSGERGANLSTLQRGANLSTIQRGANLSTVQRGANLSTLTRALNKPDVHPSFSRRIDSFPAFLGLEQFKDRVAITDQGSDYNYEDLYMRSWDLSKGLIGLLNEQWTNQRICVLCDTGLSHVITTWACWMAGNVVVPLPVNASKEKLEHIIRNSGATVVISTKNKVDQVNSITKSADLKLIALDNCWWKCPETPTDNCPMLPAPFVESSFYKDGIAMLLYTAGRSGNPRGMVLSHALLTNQIQCTVESWDISSEDTVLHALSLHQMYSLVNSLYAPLHQRARVITLNSFQPEKVWSHLLGMNKSNPVTLFPGTPSIFNSLLSKAGDIFKDKKSKEYVKNSCTKKIRLMTSSATSLQEQVNSQWKTLTGHKILNNYVCTEAGIVLSNRVAGATNLQGPGCQECGSPVSGMEVRLVRYRDHTKTTFDVELEESGDQGMRVLDTDLLESKGGSIVGEMLFRGENAVKRFCTGGVEKEVPAAEGWISTGDIVFYSAGCYSVKGKLGIKNVEVGEEFVNAVELERKLLQCPDIDDATVLGLGSTDAEQKIAAIIVLNKQNRKINIEHIREWCKNNMAENMIPTEFKIVEDIARGSSGHVDKFKVFQLFPEVPVLCFHDSKL